MLFALSRLEIAISFYVVWADYGRELEALTEKLEETAFNVKLRHLEKIFEKKYGVGTPPHSAMAAWLKEADAARELRNELVHGRWGIATHEQKVANVIGLPTSPRQRETRYSIADLQQVLGRVERLEPALGKLRKKWPL
jgi:hypothetical protein